jgi:hypothetical protein
VGCFALKRKQLAILLIAAAILAASLSLSWYTRRAFGEITIEKQDIVRSNGRVVSFRVYKPAMSTYGKPFPAVLTIHGISSSGAMMDAFNIELARRNFTVVSLDIAGHGRSPEQFGFVTFPEIVLDGYEALRHVQISDPDTNDTLYGVLGHSLGAGISLLFNNVSVRPASTVIIGGGLGDQFGGLELPLNETQPANLMIAVGSFDELVSPEVALDALRLATGISNPVPGGIYGSFAEGTARKLVFSPTNHQFEMSDATIVTQSIDWLGRSLQGIGQTEDSTLSASQHVYQYTSLLDIVALVASLFVALAIMPITYSVLPEHLRPEWRAEENEPLERRDGLRFSLIAGLLSWGVFVMLMLSGTVFDFAGLSIVPVSFATSFILISLIVSLLIFWITRRYMGGTMIKTLIFDAERNPRGLLRNLSRALLVVIPSVLWLLGVSIAARLGLDNTLAFTFPVDSNAALFRGLYMIVLALSFIPLFYADTIWLNASIGITSSWADTKELIERSLSALLSRLLGLIVIVSILYAAFFAMVNLGFIMFIALLLLPISVLYGFTVLVSVYVGGITGSNLTPAVFNAILFALVIVGTFQLV